MYLFLFSTSLLYQILIIKSSIFLQVILKVAFFLTCTFIILLTYLKVNSFFYQLLRCFVPSLQLTITLYHLLINKSTIFLKNFSFLLEYTTYILFFSFNILILSPFVPCFLWYNVISRIVLIHLFGGIVW